MTAGVVVEIGESFVGEGAEAAHVNTVLGSRTGPVGTAWSTALATPTTGHAPFMCVLRPGIPVQPPTLFVNKAAIAGERHGTLTWGAAQAGVATGVRDFVHDPAGLDPAGDLRLGDGRGHPLASLVLICAVWVNPAAQDEDLVFANNAAATRWALEVGSGRRAAPPTAGVAAVNPYFTGGGT